MLKRKQTKIGLHRASYYVILEIMDIEFKELSFLCFVNLFSGSLLSSITVLLVDIQNHINGTSLFTI